MIVNTELSRSKGHAKTDLWETPQHIFLPLDAEFNFTLDPCCTIETAKCPKFYTPIEDGLKRDWAGERVYANPPYSRNNIEIWVYKCWQESLKPNTKVIALLPVSTSARWFHDFVLPYADLRFYKGRIRFVGAPYTAPFSSVLAIYK